MWHFWLSICLRIRQPSFILLFNAILKHQVHILPLTSLINQPQTLAFNRHLFFLLFLGHFWPLPTAVQNEHPMIFAVFILISFLWQVKSLNHNIFLTNSAKHCAGGLMFCLFGLTCHYSPYQQTVLLVALHETLHSFLSSPKRHILFAFSDGSLSLHWKSCVELRKKNTLTLLNSLLCTFLSLQIVWNVLWMTWICVSFSLWFEGMCSCGA